MYMIICYLSKKKCMILKQLGFIWKYVLKWFLKKIVFKNNF